MHETDANEPQPGVDRPEADLPPLVLASTSPRRRELLRRVVTDFDVVAASIDETVHDDETPKDLVARLASGKANRVAAERPAALVLAADTTVAVDGSPIGKPADLEEARAILERLSGRTHTVLTGVAMAGADRRSDVRVESATVRFATLSDVDVDWYLGTGEPLGKAGAYALQGRGAALVEHLEGDPTTVIGLPLRATLEMMRAAGFSPVAGQDPATGGRSSRSRPGAGPRLG